MTEGWKDQKDTKYFPCVELFYLMHLVLVNNLVIVLPEQGTLGVRLSGISKSFPLDIPTHY